MSEHPASTDVGEVDLVCVGGGLGGLAAAATATALGLRCVVVEASSCLGGGGAYSGGLLWAPLEPDDDLEEADRYLAAVQGERAGDDALRRAVLEAAVEALGWFRSRGVPIEVVPDNPDVFHPGAPGSRASGRMWEVALPGPRLGHVRPLLQPTPHYRVGLRHREQYGGRIDAISLRELRARREAEDMLTLGPGLAAGFLHAAAVAADADLVLGERVVGLLADGARVAGVRTDAGREVRARLGVVLATGGYVRPADVHPGTDVPLHSQLFDVMGLPHTLVVNRDGERFGDESYYVGINEALGRWSAEDKRWTNVPCWLVVDEQFRRRYPLATVPAGAAYPETVTSAPDLTALADRIGVDAERLVAAVDRFNAGAERGEDPDFGRGSRPFVRRRYGDPAHEPNPNLGPVSEPPFHALPLRLLGTGMCTFGLRTDEHARVLRPDGSAVPGLHATGNAAATTEFRGYITGWANTRNIAMAHRAVLHLAQEGTTS